MQMMKKKLFEKIFGPKRAIKRPLSSPSPPPPTRKLPIASEHKKNYGNLYSEPSEIEEQFPLVTTTMTTFKEEAFKSLPQHSR
jgi:hypothetical protein